MWSSYRSQFSTLQPNFLKICSLGLWEKRFFSVFRNFHFWRFYGLFSFFSEFFPLCLCIGYKPPHSTYKHNFWHVGSLWHRKSKNNFFLLKTFIFDDLRAIFENFWLIFRCFCHFVAVSPLFWQNSHMFPFSSFPTICYTLSCTTGLRVGKLRPRWTKLAAPW